MSDATSDSGAEQRPGWGIFRGIGEPVLSEPPELPKPPPWRRFPRSRHYRGETYRADPLAIETVNAALYLRRPLLVTGKPGAGKSTLAYAVARELRLDRVLRWNITSRTTLQDGLYHYDALARLHDYNMKRQRPIGHYITLGPLATALLPQQSPKPRPRVLLIDEIDKADIDLPNDLLNILEEGAFEIRELAREQKFGIEPGSIRVTTAEGEQAELGAAQVECTEFPFVVLTSNDERDFPAPFLRRCIRLYLPSPDEKMLARIVDAHLPVNEDDPNDQPLRTERLQLIRQFVDRTRSGDLATDQLLNAVFMLVSPGAATPPNHPARADAKDRQRLLSVLLRHLTNDASGPVAPELTALARPAEPAVSDVAAPGATAGTPGPTT